MRLMLPRSVAPLLLVAEPEVFGLRYRGYGYGGIHLDIIDPIKYQQTLWAIQESFTSGDDLHSRLWYFVSRLRVFRSRATVEDQTGAPQ